MSWLLSTLWVLLREDGSDELQREEGLIQWASVCHRSVTKRFAMYYQYITSSVV
jgi:hypothetical protein